MSRTSTRTCRGIYGILVAILVGPAAAATADDWCRLKWSDDVAESRGDDCSACDDCWDGDSQPNGDGLPSRCWAGKSKRSDQWQTVGSLFRWSSDPGTGSLPQPDDPLVTDRPDFADASSVVGLGVLQVESGYTYTYDNAGGDQQISQGYPETLFRYGVITNWLEFRLATEHLEESENGGPSLSNNDLYLALRFGLTPQHECLPQMALTPQIRVPTGGAARADRVLASLSWSYLWKFNDTYSLTGTTLLSDQIDDGSDANYAEFAQAFSLSFQLADPLTGYTEYYSLHPHNADTVAVEHYFDGGLLYQINDDLQFDIRAGRGLNGDADDYFVGSGLSVRLR